MLQLPLNFQPSDVLAPSAQPLAPDLVFTRHPRARRYVIRITDEGTVRVTVPRWGSKREAAAFAAREHAWIAKQLRMQAERQLKARERRTASDETAAHTATAVDSNADIRIKPRESFGVALNESRLATRRVYCPQ